MSVIKYYDKDPLTVSTEDLMPMVLIILSFIVSDCLKWSLMMGTDLEYPDLREWIDQEQLSLEDFELLDSSSDKRICLMGAYISYSSEVVDDYLNLFPFNLEEIYTDERLLDLAGYFYGTLVYEVVAEGDDDYFSRLTIFMECVLQVLYCLCELVICSKVDLEAAFEYNGSCYKLHDGDWDSYIDAEEHEFRLLAKLMKETLHCQNELYEAFP